MAPHRSLLILTLGIISLVALPLCFWFPLIGMCLGVAAWSMGRADLVKMRQGNMDATGRNDTNIGRLCGMIGTCLNLFVFIIFAVILAAK
jgi:hypothetical protein